MIEVLQFVCVVTLNQSLQVALVAHPPRMLINMF
jgi:hypothetical protein